jgi:hypothetical protein
MTMNPVRAASNVIVRCYPRQWRNRYEAEVLDIVEARGASWLDVADLAGGCGREWLRGEWNHPVVGRVVFAAVIIAVAMAVELTALLAVRAWQESNIAAPPAPIIALKGAVPFICCVAMLASMAWNRRVQFFIAWALVVLVFMGAVLDRFAAYPLGMLYAFQIMWLGTMLYWDEIARSPYTSTSALGLRGSENSPRGLVFPRPPAKPLGLDDAGDR